MIINMKWMWGCIIVFILVFIIDLVNTGNAPSYIEIPYNHVSGYIKHVWRVVCGKETYINVSYYYSIEAYERQAMFEDLHRDIASAKNYIKQKVFGESKEK